MCFARGTEASRKGVLVAEKNWDPSLVVTAQGIRSLTGCAAGMQHMGAAEQLDPFICASKHATVSYYQHAATVSYYQHAATVSYYKHAATVTATTNMQLQ